MKKICILIGLTLLMSGASLDNKAEVSIPEQIDSTIKVDTVVDRFKTLDSLLMEIKKETNGKKK